MAREEKLVIKLEERMKFQFQQYADRMGVTMSALGAFVVGQWVDSQNRLNQVSETMVGEAVGAMQKKVNDTTVDESLESLLKNPQILELMMTAFASAEREAKAQA